MLWNFFDEIDWEYQRTYVVDKEGGKQINIELPGIDKKDIDISITDRILKIKKKEKTIKSYDIPQGFDLNKIKANMENGLLTVHVPYSNEIIKINVD